LEAATSDRDVRRNSDRLLAVGGSHDAIGCVGRGCVSVADPVEDATLTTPTMMSAGMRRVRCRGSHEPRVGLDEQTTRFHFVAHERLERLVGEHGVFHGHAQHRARLRIHRRLPELLGVHFAETLVALHHDVAAPFTTERSA
jgi:hypothetical protein